MNSTYATNYQVLCIGVNEGPGGTTLNLAEKDATDIYNVFTGALGPPHAKGCCLTEQLATQQGVIGKLKALASQPPRFLLLYILRPRQRDGNLALEWPSWVRSARGAPSSN